MADFEPVNPGPPPPVAMSPAMVTTGLELAGYRIVRNLGVVRGIVVRSRSVFGTIGASLQTLVGGDITLYTELCEKTRQDAFVRMMQHAMEHGANAIIARATTPTNSCRASPRFWLMERP